MPTSQVPRGSNRMTQTSGITSLPAELLSRIFGDIHQPVIKRDCFFSLIGDDPSPRRLDYGYAQRALARLMRVCKAFNRAAAPVLYRRVQTFDLLHMMINVDSAGVPGCPSKRELCGMVRCLNVEYPPERRAESIQLYVRSLSAAEHRKVEAATDNCLAPEVTAKYNAAAAKELKRVFAAGKGKGDAAFFFPSLTHLSFASLGHAYRGRSTAGTTGPLDMFAPKHVCITTVPRFVPRRQSKTPFWPANVSRYLQVGTKDQKIAHIDPPESTDTLTVHFDNIVNFKGALPLALPNGVTHYLLPLPSLKIGLSATARAHEIGEWIFELMNPKVYTSEQYEFVFHIQCLSKTSPKYKPYNDKMQEVLEEWMVKARDREQARIERQGMDQDYEELDVTWELVEDLPFCEGCGR